MSLQNIYTKRAAVGVNDPGLLDRQVVLESPSGGVDASGNPMTIYSSVAVVWASKRALRGSRKLIGSMEAYEADVMFRIRWRADVSAGWRLVHGSSTYEIKETEELGRHHLIDLACLAVNQPTQG